jgi:DNA recombination protein RmuC
VHELGRDLYRRLSAMGGHIVGLGASLAGSVNKYNDFVGSLERSVMPQARRFNELEVEGAGDPLPVALPLEAAPRRLQPARDIALAPPPSALDADAAC